MTKSRSSTPIPAPLQEFRRALAALKRRKSFIHVRDSGRYADELDEVLTLLLSRDLDPAHGLDAITSFFAADESIMNACDDSNGIVGDVFQFHATDLFVKFAAECPGKERIASLVMDLDKHDDYAVREKILHRAAEFLPEPLLRALVEESWTDAANARSDLDRRRCIYRIETLAQQLKDAPLYEKATRAAVGEPDLPEAIDIARVYLDAGDPATALSWAGRFMDDHSHWATRRDELLMTIYAALNDRRSMNDLAWKMFRHHYSIERLNQLLAIVGMGKRERIVDDAVRDIHSEKELKLSDVHFMLSVHRLDDAERYILDRADQIDGDCYGDLLEFLTILEPAGKSVTSSLLYRALIESILHRARSVIYSHAVRYMRHLDALASNVKDWKTFASHADYLLDLRARHGRKSAFWGKYERYAKQTT